MSLLPVGISGEEAVYQIERSLRFNSADSAYLNRTPASAGNRKTWTWSAWVKRSALGSIQTLFNAGANSATTGYTFIDFTSTDTFRVGIRDSGGVQSAITTQVFRDPSAWGHLIVAVDTTQATASNRVKIYFNGSQITALGTANYPTQNTDTSVNNTVAQRLGVNVDSGGGLESYLDGYLTEVNFIDGSALTPSSFGETDTDTGVWKPKKYTGSYGTNGFYLNFSDNSGTTSTTLGKDSSGNGNNWAPNNFSVTAGAGNDSLVDSPTNYGTDTGAGGEVRGNYAIINPINGAGTALTISNGNLDFGTSSSNYGLNVCSMSIKDKTYFEITLGSSSVGSGKNSYCGIGSFGSANSYSTAAYLGSQAFSWSLGYSNTTAYISNNGTQSTQSGTIANGDVFMYAVDPANGSIWFGRNGTWYAGNPSAGTGASYTNLPTEVFPVVQAYNSSTHSINFGQRPFAYTAPSGFKALCTQNLPEPTIVDGSQYFDATAYTGTGTALSVVNSGGMPPDFVWIKNRTNAYSHLLFDKLRGATTWLQSNDTSADQTNAQTLTSFNSNGFSVGTNVSPNGSGNAIIAWQWRANGAGSSNTDGTITSTVSANTDSGFSIVSYTTLANTVATVGHGLGVVPDMVIAKTRSAAAAWNVWHKDILISQRLRLDDTSAATSSTVWDSTLPTSNVFTQNISTTVQTAIAYCFHSVEGFSKFGSYTGNGSADGPMIFTNFRPRYVLTKRTDSTAAWYVHDTARNTYNVCNLALSPDLADAEVSANNNMDILSNGFKIRNSGAWINASGGTYIYMAFAENPFKYSLAR